MKSNLQFLVKLLPKPSCHLCDVFVEDHVSIGDFEFALTDWSIYVIEKDLCKFLYLIQEFLNILWLFIHDLLLLLFEMLICEYRYAFLFIMFKHKYQCVYIDFNYPLYASLILIVLLLSIYYSLISLFHHGHLLKHKENLVQVKVNQEFLGLWSHVYIYHFTLRQINQSKKEVDT